MAGQVKHTTEELVSYICALRLAIMSHPLFEDDECDCGFRISHDLEHQCHEARWKRNADRILEITKL